MESIGDIKMKYYADPGSGSCRRVSAVIEYLGVEVEEVFIDLFKGEADTPEFLAINPNGMVPALVDGKSVVWEAAAIMIYLCEQAGNHTLWPQGPARYEVLRWMFWAAEHFRQPAPMYFEERIVAKLMGHSANESRIVEADRRMLQFAPVLEAHLENRTFVMGDHVTLADFDLAAPLSQMPRTRVPYDTYPNIMQWYQQLNEVPAWRITGERLEQRMNSAIAAAGIDTNESSKLSKQEIS